MTAGPKSITESEFQHLVASERSNLLAHAYRMLASPQDAEDAVQEALGRAWQHRDSYEGAGPLAGWLYRITTNLCIDRLRTAKRRGFSPYDYPPARPGAPPTTPDPDLAWVEPLPDRVLGETPEPGLAVVRREHVRLAFVAALQRLPARQRAALLLHDVVGFSPDETAGMLEVTRGALNGLLHRARTSIADTEPALVSADPKEPQVAGLLQRYVDAWERADIELLTEVVAEDVYLAMPPLFEWYQGRGPSMGFVNDSIFRPIGPGVLSLRPCTVNGSAGFLLYEKYAGGVSAPSGVHVLDIAMGPRVASIISFRDPDVIAYVAAHDDWS